MIFEVVIPLRNPTGVLKSSVDSLAAQTDRDFSVLISDNHSTSGDEHMTEALETLGRTGIAAKTIRTPTEFERVEHWNWLHFQSHGEWIKPLFAGDWLEADYIASVRQEINAAPECRYVYSGYRYHDATNDTTMDVIPAWTGGFRSAAEMREVVLRYGHQFGPPSCAAYQRDAFCAVGGYRTTLPICADSLFFCALAERFGAAGIARPLSNFQMHSARFSTLLPGRRKAVMREQLTYITTLLYHARTEQWPVSRIGMLKLFGRELRDRLRNQKAS